MDNTDVKKRVILVQRKRNSLTGETVTRTRPKTSKRQRVVVARGKGSKTIGDVLLARLKPLAFAIRTGLAKRGYNTAGMNFKSQVAVYYNEFSGRKPVDVSEFINHVAFKLKTTDNPNGDIEDARNKQSMMEVNEIVTSVMNVFSTAKHKHEALAMQGQNPRQFMTDEQLTQARAAMIVQEKLLREFRHDNFVTQGDLMKWIKWVVIGGLVIWLLWRYA